MTVYSDYQREFIENNSLDGLTAEIKKRNLSALLDALCGKSARSADGAKIDRLVSDYCIADRFVPATKRRRCTT